MLRAGVWGLLETPEAIAVGKWNGPNHRAKATVLMGSVGLAVIPMRYERHFEGAIKALDKGLTVFFQKCLSNPCHGEMD